MVAAHRDRLVAPAFPLVAGLSACLPEPASESLLDEYPEVIGLSMEVVEGGPWSTDLLPIPADRIRSEALPGDRVRLTALAADRDGVLDLDALEARWLLLRSSVLQTPPRELPLSCDPSVPLDIAGFCDAGSGASIELTVPPLSPELGFYSQAPIVVVVVGVELSTAECLERLSHGLDQITWDCLVARRPLNLGPVPHLLRLMDEQGIPLEGPDPRPGFPQLPDPSELPTAFTPDFAPRTRWITLSRPGEVLSVWPGERTRVPQGARFTADPAVEPRDRQTIPRFGIDNLPTGEGVGRRWYTTGVEIGGGELLFREAGSFTVFVITTDTRESQTWSIFDFDVVPP